MSIETVLETIGNDIEVALEAAWAVLKPDLQSLGQTVLSQAATAAQTLVDNGFSMTNFVEAVGSVMASLPADAVAAEEDVSAAIVAFFKQISTDLTATGGTATTGTASTGTTTATATTPPATT